MARASGLYEDGDSVRGAEAGRAHSFTFQRLLAGIAEQAVILSEQRKDPALISKALLQRRHAARYLAQAETFNHPCNAILYEALLLSGNEAFEKTFDCKNTSLRMRDSHSGPGNIGKNLYALVTLVGTGCVDRFKAPSQPLEHAWRDDLVNRYIDSAVDTILERIRPLRTPTKTDKLAAGTLLLASVVGERRVDALKKHFGISNGQAEALVNLEPITAETSGCITQKLRDEYALPSDLCEQLTATWSSVKIEPNSRAVLAEKIRQGLEENLLTFSSVARLLDMTVAEPGSKLRAAVQNLYLGTTLTSFHTLGVLSCKDVPEVNSLMEELLDAARSLPSQRGQEREFHEQLLVQYGLKLHQLPRRLQQRIQEAEQKGVFPADLTDAISDIGERKSIEAIKTWIAVFEPRSITDFIDGLTIRHDSLAPIVQAAKTSHATLKEYRNGARFPSIPALRRLLACGETLPNEALLASWHLSAPEHAPGSGDAFSRGLWTLIASHAESYSAFFNPIESSLSTTAHEVMRVTRQVIQGKPSRFESRRHELILAACAARSIDERALSYLRLCVAEQDPHARLTKWFSGHGASLGWQNAAEFAESALSLLEPRGVHSLKLLMDKKERLLARYRHYRETPTLLDEEAKEMKTLNTLALLPGVLKTELRLCALPSGQ